MNGTPRFATLMLSIALGTSAALASAQDHDHDHGQDRDHRQTQGQSRNQDQGRPDYHFRADDRDHLRGHYQSNLGQWRNNPRRPRFNPGDRLPPNYRVQAVPSSYYRGVPPPPPGYRFGYYGGYVVAYNPTTRIIADVLDLVAGQ